MARPAGLAGRRSELLAPLPGLPSSQRASGRLISAFQITSGFRSLAGSCVGQQSRQRCQASRCRSECPAKLVAEYRWRARQSPRLKLAAWLWSQAGRKPLLAQPRPAPPGGTGTARRYVGPGCRSSTRAIKCGARAWLEPAGPGRIPMHPGKPTDLRAAGGSSRARLKWQGQRIRGQSLPA